MTVGLNWMEKVVNNLISVLFSLCFFGNVSAQDDPLVRRIDVSISNLSTAEALEKVSQAGKFYFSYNAAGIESNRKVSLVCTQKPVKEILKEILGKGYSLKSGGNHVIILSNQEYSNPKKGTEYQISGSILDAKTGKHISSVSVIEIGKRNMTSTDKTGSYSIPIRGNAEFTKLLVSRSDYRDTVILIKAFETDPVQIRLQPLPQINTLQSLDAAIPIAMEENGLFRTMVSEDQLILSQNMPLYEQRYFQASFLPNLGTNQNFSGLVENHISFNLLGGYSMALSGFELGGLFNITRRHVHGMQLGGIMNITGAELSGVQIAGFMNNNIGAVNGVQTAGFYNLSLDSLRGVQLSGFFNMARNRVKGVQASGFMNISGKELNGVQASGFMNLSGRDATGAQLAGFANLATGNMKGLQASGFLNLSTGSMRGAQISGGVNVTVDTTYTLQVASIANFARWIYGTQIGLFNVAGEVGGSQVGLINYCDTVKGLPLGLISIVRKGLHQLEISQSDISELNITLRSGTFRLHNILSAGLFQVKNSSLASFGYGLGTMTRHKRKLGFGAEGVISIVFNESLKPSITPDFWLRGLAYLSYQPLKGLQFFAGPSFQAFRIDQSNLPGIHPDEIIKFSSYNQGSGTISTWLGWQAGIRFF